MRRERQKQGFNYEEYIYRKAWAAGDIDDQILEQLLSKNYTAKWDANKGTLSKLYHSSIKTFKIGGTLYLGDVLRQYDIDGDFKIYLGVRNIDSSFKDYVYIMKLTEWRRLWGDLERDELIVLINLVKSLPPNSSLVVTNKHRAKCKMIAKKLSKKTDGITIHCKIDTKKQRRVQCSSRKLQNIIINS